MEPSELQFRKYLLKHFNLVTPEYEMNFRITHAREGNYDFTAADEICRFAKKHGLEVRGHNLVWHAGLPTWVNDPKITSEQLRIILKDHIQTTIRHFKVRYPSLIRSWIVVNEAIEEDGSFRKSPFTRIGNSPDEYIKLAFVWAHEADPSAILIYNEKHAEGINPRSNAVYELLKKLLSEKIPVNGVGLQLHVRIDEFPPPAEVMENMKRLDNLGLQTTITELDVRLPKKDFATRQALEKQASIYEGFVNSCTKQKSCKDISMWGFTDLHSWVPNYFKGDWGAALPFDDRYRPKPAYYSIMKTLTKNSAR